MGFVWTILSRLQRAVSAWDHTLSLGADIYGNIQRMDNMFALFEEQLHACEEQLANIHVQLANAQEQVQAPFPQEEELKAKSARLDELNILLNLDKRDNSLTDEAPEEEVPGKSKARDYER